MKIIELNEKQFNNYSKRHSKKNIFQTIEYAKSQLIYNFSIIYLGLIDDNDNVLGATLILVQTTLKKYKIGYIPGGFLLDYSNINLLTNFTNELKIYLRNNKFIYLRTNSSIECKKYSNDLKLISNDDQILKNLEKLGYKFVQLNKNFFKYRTVIINNDLNNIYSNMKRHTKRNINDALKMGIIVEESNEKSIDTFYELIKKKNKNSINYFNNIIENFNNKNIEAKIYYAKLDCKTLINNYMHFLNEEENKNDKLNTKLMTSKDEKILNKKMQSDALIEKYKIKIKEATQLLKEYPDTITLSTSLIITNNKEVFFLSSGYNDNLKQIRSLELLKWEIIKKYFSLGYKIFNLGELSNNIFDKNDKYNNYNKSKLGFGGIVIENSEVFDLIINSFLYKLINITKIFNFKKKDLNK